jgi:hypothetical protein
MTNKPTKKQKFVHIFDCLSLKELRSESLVIESNLNSVRQMIVESPSIINKLIELESTLEEEGFSQDSLLVNCVKYTFTHIWKEMLDREIFLREEKKC